MKPIVIEEYENPIYKKEEKEIIDETEYRFEHQYNFMPGFMEECYDDKGVDKLKESNQKILHYSKIRKELQYIASLKEGEYIAEYYYDKESNIVGFLIDKVFKDTQILASVGIYKKIECEVN